MSEFLHSVEPDTLLAHNAWMRRLARNLVLDESEADDVVQEAWLKATERPPRQAESLRAWLATVVRNAARQLARSESRRDRRELAAARPEGLPSTAELVARAEARRTLTDAVLSVDEPFKSTLLLRYFEGLPPREIAKLQGVPVETVRSRVRRGLERTRRALDADHDGGRQSWMAALLPLAAPPIPGALPPPDASPGPSSTPSPRPSPGPASAPATSLGTAVAASLVLLVGTAGGWLAGAADRDGAIDLRTRISAERARATELGTDRATALRRIDGLRRSAIEPPETPRAVAPPAPVAATTQPANSAARETAARGTGDGAPRFAFPAFATTLGGIDWDVAGREFGALIRAIGPVMRPFIAGGLPPAIAVGELQMCVAPVSARALRLQADGFPGVLPNAALAHPAILANLLPGAMAELGVPLDAAQETALERLAQSAAARIARRPPVDSSAPLLRRVADDAAALGPWLDSVDGILTQTQRDVLRPVETRGRAGLDLVSPGLLWPTMAAGVHVAGRAEYAREIEATFLTPVFPADTSERPADTSERPAATSDRVVARTILDDWLRTLPDAAFAGPDGAPDALGFVTASRMAFWTERLADLIDRLRAEAATTDAQRDHLAKSFHPRVPILTEALPR